MARLQKNRENAKWLLVNDHGSLVKIKQPSFREINALYRTILANIIKNRIRHVD